MAFVPMCNKVQALKEHPRSTIKTKDLFRSGNQFLFIFLFLFLKEARERKNEKGVRSLSIQQVLFSAQAA